MDYDWDDIQIDETLMHNSHHFFAQKHVKHEKPMNIVEIKTENEDTTLTNGVNVELDLQGMNLESDNKENAETNEDVKPINQEPITASSSGIRVRNKVVTPSRWGQPTGAIPKVLTDAPKAYKFKDLYHENREKAIREQQERERKMREFRSRPMPAFKPIVGIKNLQHVCTSPKTPQVVKRSRLAEQRRKEKMEELIRHNQMQKLKPCGTTVLETAPFVPKKEPHVVEPKPFHLLMEQRLQERKKYDQMFQAALEEKQKQEEEHRKLLEEERIKELRKATIFKARPNPFKK